MRMSCDMERGPRMGKRREREKREREERGEEEDRVLHNFFTSLTTDKEED